MRNIPWGIEAIRAPDLWDVLKLKKFQGQKNREEFFQLEGTRTPFTEIEERDGEIEEEYVYEYL
ncbi:hypothetical protein J2S78_000139 [Salibacterium salarium]|nr:hypothetical protein [Salibacterium salarium]